MRTESLRKRSSLHGGEKFWRKSLKGKKDGAFILLPTVMILLGLSAFFCAIVHFEKTRLDLLESRTSQLYEKIEVRNAVN